MAVGFTRVDDDLYREIILDHYRSPRHRGTLSPSDGTVEADNPLCGDEIKLTWRLQGGRVDDIAFHGKGCSISQAAASMLCDEVAGRSCEDALAMAQRYQRMLVADGDAGDIGDLEALRGVKAYPVRVKCATLACNAIIQALEGDVSGGTA